MSLLSASFNNERISIIDPVDGAIRSYDSNGDEIMEVTLRVDEIDPLKWFQWIQWRFLMASIGDGATK